MEKPDEGFGDPAAGFSLLRHVAEGWTQVDDALHKIRHVLHDLGKAELWFYILNV